MENPREQLLSSVLVERRLVAPEDLRRLASEVDRLRATGAASTLAALLVRERRLDADRLRILLREVEVRGRACGRCQRALLVGPAGPAACPTCQGPLAPLSPSPTTPLPESDDEPRSAFFRAVQSGTSPVLPPRPTPRPRTATPFPPESVDREAPTVRGVNPSDRVTRVSEGTDGTDRAARTERLADSSGRLRALQEEQKPTARMDSERLGAVLEATARRPATPPVPPTPRPAGTPRPPGTPPPGTPRPATPPAGTTPGGARRGRALGKTLGAYDVLDEIGSGGMGVVYRARRSGTEHVVALKVLIGGDLAGEKLRLRFQEEARAASKLEHENIVPILDVGDVDGLTYYTMKLIDGDLLHQLMERGELSVERGAELIRDVARAAHHAHGRGIVHRDLKPTNVIVERATGKPYLMDFGLAKDLGSDLGLSKTGLVLGTPYYMPPEQAEGKHKEIDGRADVYSLGATLFELLAGRVPFEATSQSDLIRQIVEDEPVRPSSLKPGSPPGLEAIALKALAKAKHERYFTAEDLAQDIERFLRGESPKALDEGWLEPRKKPPPLVRAVSVDRGGDPPGDRSQELAPAPPSQSTAVIAFVASFGAVLVVAIGLAAWWTVRERARREHEAAEVRRLEEQKQLELSRRREQLAQSLERGEGRRAAARSAPSAKAARAALEEARAELEKALALAEPDSEARARALYGRALVARDLGSPADLALAKADLAVVASAAGFQARALFASGAIVHRRDHEPDHARAIFQAALEPSAPADPTGRAEEKAAAALAQAYLDLIAGDPPAAHASVRKALAADAPGLTDSIADTEAFIDLISAPPDEPSWHALRATRAAERGLAANRWRYDLLVEHAWARALADDVRKAEASIALARDLCPDAPDVRVAESWLAVRQSKEKEALAAIEQGRAAQPGARRFWDAIGNKIAAALDARKVAAPPGQQGARSLWSDLALVYPGKLGPRVEAVQAAIEDRRLPEALVLLEQLEKDVPKFPSFSLWRARLLLEANRAGEASEIVAAVLARWPDEPMALTLEAGCDARIGNLGKAKDALRRCVERHPELRTPRIFLAQLATASRDWLAVSDALGPLVADDESDVDAAALLAEALVAADKLPDALELAKRAVEVQPRFAATRVALAHALLRSDHAADALATLDEGLGLLPDLPAFRREKVAVLRKLGRAAEADALEKKLGR